MSPDEAEALQERLATCERRFRYLIEAATDAIVAIARETGELVGGNPAFHDLFGISLDEAVGNHWSSIVHPGDVEHFAGILRDHLAGDLATRRAPLRMRRPGGGPDLECELTLHKPGTARVTVVTIRDVTDQNRVARELREAQARLVQQDKMASLGALVAGVAHELNTPLGSIVSNADVAARAAARLRESLPALEVAATRALAALEGTTEVTRLAAARMSDIVRSLRSFARLDEAEVKEVDLHEGIESALTLLGHVFTDRIRIVRDYGTLPRLTCHPSQLNQVFMNVLANAAQAIEGPGTITITTRTRGETLEVAVCDTGGGVAPEHRARLFDPGFTTKGVGVGTGLGLSICWRIVADHGGTIEVDSDPGAGATFTIRLPAPPAR